MAQYTKITRRQFMAGTVAAGAALAVPWYFDTGTAFAFYQSQGLKKFIQPLRGVGPGGIPVAAPDAFSAPVTGVTHYSFTSRSSRISYTLTSARRRCGATTRSCHWAAERNPRSTSAAFSWCSAGSRSRSRLRTRCHRSTSCRSTPASNFPEAQKHQNATTTHVHGGFTPWISDGGPFTWFTPDGQYGQSVHSAAGNIYKLLNPGLSQARGSTTTPTIKVLGLPGTTTTPIDLTRLNAYAGIASAYIIRDSFEAILRNLGLPDFIENGGREIPIVIQDKIFVGPNIDDKDPTWPGPKGVGSLWYPHKYEKDRWQLGPHPLGLPPNPSVIPEMFGDTMLANGTVYPEATVEARRYRLRILNACQARFLNLQLYVDDGSPDGITLDMTVRAHQ